MLSRHLASFVGYELTKEQRTVADINGDGSINGTDSIILAQYLAGWESAMKYFKSN